MTIIFTPRPVATVINPGTQLPYVYTAGENINQGEIVCKSETDNKIYRAQCTSWSRMPAFGVAAETRLGGQSIKVLQFGVIVNVSGGGAFNWDDELYVSELIGQATNTPPSAIGDLAQNIGRAMNATDMIVQLDQTVVQVEG